jgi:hypothetical protein
MEAKGGEEEGESLRNITNAELYRSTESGKTFLFFPGIARRRVEATTKLYLN